MPVHCVQHDIEKQVDLAHWLKIITSGQAGVGIRGHTDRPGGGVDVM